MGFGDLAQALAILAVAVDGGVVELATDYGRCAGLQERARRMPARTRSMMRFALQFSDGADDNHDGPAQRTAGVDLFAKN